MKNLKNLGAALVIALIALSGADDAQSKSDEIRFGSVAMDIPAVMHRRLSPLIDYLEKTLGRPVSLRLSPSMKDAIGEIASGRVDIAYLTPVAYLRAKEKGNTRIVVKTVTNKHDSFQLMLAVRQDSPIKTVRDLVGKSFAFGDPAALLQRAVVVNAGIGLQEFGDYKFIGHYDSIARGVVSGDFDAGILKDTMAQAWTKKGLRILHASPHLPPYNISVRGDIDEMTFKKIESAFLMLTLANPDHKAVIKALDKRYDGFVATDDQEYDVVRRLTKPFWNQ